MKVTEKPVQQHLECACGHNAVINETWLLSKAKLRKLGYKLRKCVGSGQSFYFRYAYDQECRCHEAEEIGSENFYYDDQQASTTPVIDDSNSIITSAYKTTEL